MVRRKSHKTAFLGLGGNLGDPAAAMGKALSLLTRDGRTELVTVSSLYRTPPWGKTDQPDFLNAVARIATSLEPGDLLAACLEAERKLKRVRRERWGPRPIDMDLLWYDGRSIEIAGLTIPHPRMLERAFVLLPLAEIAPDLDLSGQSARQRADAVERAGIAIVRTGDWWRSGPAGDTSRA